LPGRGTFPKKSRGMAGKTHARPLTVGDFQKGRWGGAGFWGGRESLPLENSYVGEDWGGGEGGGWKGMN